VVNVGTPSRLSFPSAHATSTTAAAILIGRATGLPLPAALIPLMALSRILLGVHYPSDVACGVALGVVVARVAERLESRLPGNGRPSGGGVAHE
jgi:membrane-associated phospholipid phosphatase